MVIGFQVRQRDRFESADFIDELPFISKNRQDIGNRQVVQQPFGKPLKRWLLGREETCDILDLKAKIIIPPEWTALPKEVAVDFLPN